MIYYIGDMHLGHANVIRHDSRPFSNVDEMNEALINNYNSIVTDKDDVYFVGDVIFKNYSYAIELLQRLKGKKHLVIGNHDKSNMKKKEFRDCFIDCKDYYDIKDGNDRVIISHYPMIEWDGYFRGSYHVYAHIHNNIHNAAKQMMQLERALNSGCMINNYIPVTLKQMIVNNQIFKEQNK